MTSTIIRHEIPAPIAVVLGIVLIGAFAYAIVARQFFLVPAIILFTAINVYIFYLFFRLVVAVERIADNM